MGRKLVTAVMITGKDAGRVPFALAAVRAFQLQTYSPLELVIVNDSDSPLLPLIADADSRIREVMTTPRTLGELRNVGLDAAQGNFICQWDDDDWYHPERIAKQLELTDGKTPVTLSHQVRYSFVSGSAFVYRGQTQGDGRKMGIAGTILHPRTDIRYKAKGKHEDSLFLQQWQRVAIVPLEKMPHLYLRFYTGKNTWSSDHIMGAYRRPLPWKLPPESASYLREVLRTYYSFAKARMPDERPV